MLNEELELTFDEIKKAKIEVYGLKAAENYDVTTSERIVSKATVAKVLQSLADLPVEGLRLTDTEIGSLCTRFMPSQRLDWEFAREIVNAQLRKVQPRIAALNAILKECPTQENIDAMQFRINHLQAQLVEKDKPQSIEQAMGNYEAVSRREFLKLPIEKRRELLRKQVKLLQDERHDSDAKEDLGMMD